MKKRLQFTLLLCTLLFLGASSAFAQLTVNDCYNPKQICLSCPCLMIYDPVCGCNDVTYSNSCFAYNSGVRSWTEGACGSFASTDGGQERPDLFFHSPISQEIVMEIFDQDGKVVATPLNGMVEAGKEYLISTELPTGNYLCQVTTEKEILKQEFSME